MLIQRGSATGSFLTCGNPLTFSEGVQIRLSWSKEGGDIRFKMKDVLALVAIKHIKIS